jgi:hypothetical protein
MSPEKKVAAETKLT